MGKTKVNVFSVLFLALVHTVLCIIYNNTYYDDSMVGLSGFKYYALLIAFFLAAPLCYYISGRFFNGRADKRFYNKVIWSVCGVFAVLGAVSMFVPAVGAFYRYINAPSFMYFQLMSDSVFYISVPAMLVSALFPALFARMGIAKKPRTNNEVKVEDADKSKSEEKDENK